MKELLPLLTSFSRGAKPIANATKPKIAAGNLFVSWYNERSECPVNEKALFEEKVEVNNQFEETIHFKKIPVGSYAVALYLDEYYNHKLDSNLPGIPSNRYKISIDIPPAFRRAALLQFSFRLNKQETTVSINLQ